MSETNEAQPRTSRKQRARTPQYKKQLDYKHQRRTTEGGQGWRKVVAKLPKLERRLYRHAQERALREAILNAEVPQTEDAIGLTAGDNVRGLKRKHFRLLRHRREIPLGDRVRLNRAGIRRIQVWLPPGRKQGRNWSLTDSQVKNWSLRDFEVARWVKVKREKEQQD